MRRRGVDSLWGCFYWSSGGCGILRSVQTVLLLLRLDTEEQCAVLFAVVPLPICHLVLNPLSQFGSCLTVDFRLSIADKGKRSRVNPPKASMSVRSCASTLCGMPLVLSGVLVAEIFTLLLGKAAKSVLWGSATVLQKAPNNTMLLVHINRRVVQLCHRTIIRAPSNTIMLMVHVNRRLECTADLWHKKSIRPKLVQTQFKTHFGGRMSVPATSFCTRKICVSNLILWRMRPGVSKRGNPFHGKDTLIHSCM